LRQVNEVIANGHGFLKNLNKLMTAQIS